MGELLDSQERMVDTVDTADIVDTMDIHPPMDTMVDIIPVLTDMDTTDTDILVRDPLMLNLNPNTTTTDTTTVDSIIKDTTIGDTMVDSLDIIIIEMFGKYLT